MVALERTASSVMNADVWVVVPALNEARVIRASVTELRSRFPNVVVVDDGSVDTTAAEALAAGAVVVRHALNLGQGAALKTGLDYALERDAAIVATFDADGQHHVEDLCMLVETLRNDDVDIVLGSRFEGRAQGMGLLRRCVLRAAVIFTNLTTGVTLTDAHNGLRAMTAATAQRLDIRQDKMAHASEFVAQIGRLGLRFKEVPVTITYTSYSLEKGQKLGNSFRILTDLLVGWLLR